MGAIDFPVSPEPAPDSRDPAIGRCRAGRRDRDIPILCGVGASLARIASWATRATRMPENRDTRWLSGRSNGR